MATLSVFRFETADGAEKGLETVKELQKENLIQLHDAAIVTWPFGTRRPKTHQLVNTAGAGALGGAFWGLLFGMIFFVPFVGMAVGAAIGAMFSGFKDFGISESFVKDVRAKVTEGSSALFLLTSNAVGDRVIDAFKKLPKFELLSTSLSKEEEQKLRDAFGE
ncbi:MAG: DUF1269 domain-containing protein [bacterium]